MIELTVQALPQTGGPTLYQCKPRVLCLGYQDSTGLEQLHVALPSQWAGLHGVITWLPAQGKPVAQLLPDDGLVEVTAALTAGGGGAFVVSASSGGEAAAQDKRAYSAGGRYLALPHPPTEGQAPTVPRSLYDQFVALVDRTRTGPQGASAYELAVAAGYTGTQSQWLASLKGEPGQDGQNGQAGQNGQDGQNGKSAYELAVAAGYTGTQSQWLASLKGEPGQDGQNGQAGQDGQDGKSAYELAVAAGYTGTQSQWLASLKGEPGQDGQNGQAGQDGQDGKSAYELAVAAGYTGTQSQWLASLKGEPGSDAALTADSVTDALGYIPADSWDTGDLADLTTGDKTDLVCAINEVQSNTCLRVLGEDPVPTGEWLLHSSTQQYYPVRRKYLDCGAGPAANTSRTVPHQIDGLLQVVRCTVLRYSASARQYFPGCLCIGGAVADQVAISGTGCVLTAFAQACTGYNYTCIIDYVASGEGVDEPGAE